MAGWSLEADVVLTDEDREEIAEMIRKGYDSGDVYHYHDEDE